MRGRVAAGQDDADVRIGAVWGRMGGVSGRLSGFFVFCGLPVAGWCRVLSVCENGFFPVFDGMRKGCGMGRDVYGFAEMASAGWDRKVLREADAGCRMSDVGCRMSDVGWRMSDVGWRMSDVGCRMSDVGCRMSDGGWRMADGGWRMADGGDAQDGLTVSGRAVAGVAC